MSDHDILIKNASIVDGTGSAPIKGEIAIDGERITGIGKNLGTGEKIINAGGKIVCPGFIDVHNHGDLSILYYPKAEGYLKQGITTFIGGQCGSSPAPIGEYVADGAVLYDLVHELNPAMYYPSELIRREEFNPKHRELVGWEIDWKTMGDFLKKVESFGISPNMVPMVGHGPIRIMAMGSDFERKATPEEVEAMKPHLRQAMEDGCRGFSVGRDYDPGYWAGKEELIELTKIVAEYKGVYQSHSLRTGLRKARRPGEAAPPKINGILEAIDVGRQAGVAVEISHLGSLYDVYPGGSGLLDEAAAKATLKVVDDAIDDGLDVSFDVIPNTGGYGLYSSTHLVGFLLPWLRVAGGREQLARALKMRDFREEIKASIMSGKWYGLNPNISAGWARMNKITESKNSEYLGKTVAEIAGIRKTEHLETLFDVIQEDPYTRIAGMSFSSPSKALFYKHRAMMAGIDTLALDTAWKPESAPWYLPSQNSFNGFAAYFEDVVREEKILSVEQAVHHVTGLPAKKFKLTDRGVLREGAYADIVVMDIDRVKDMSTPLNPSVYPNGIDHVLVNGVHVVKNMTHTGMKPGKVLYRE
jgi:N-acyl-D-amino-acid deacylase